MPTLKDALLLDNTEPMVVDIDGFCQVLCEEFTKKTGTTWVVQTTREPLVRALLAARGGVLKVTADLEKATYEIAGYTLADHGDVIPVVKTVSLFKSAKDTAKLFNHEWFQQFWMDWSRAVKNRVIYLRWERQILPIVDQIRLQLGEPERYNRTSSHATGEPVRYYTAFTVNDVLLGQDRYYKAHALSAHWDQHEDVQGNFVPPTSVRLEIVLPSLAAAVAVWAEAKKYLRPELPANAG